MAWPVSSYRLFFISNRCLRLLGVWPGPQNQAIQSKHLATTMLKALYFCVLIGFELRFAVNNVTAQPLLAVSCLCVISSRAMCVAKIVSLVVMHKEFKLVLETIDQMQRDSNHMNERLLRIDLVYSFVNFILVFSCAIMLVTMPFVSYWMTGNFVWELPSAIELPYDHRQPVVYALTYLFIGYGYSLHIFTTGGIDALFFSMCLYIANQFEVVKRQIWELNEYLDHFSADENEKLKIKLIEIIKQHNRCLSLSSNMAKSMSSLVLGQFVLASLQTAFSLFNFVMATGIEKATYACYSSGSFLQMYFFCNCATILAESSNISEALYKFQWYRCNKTVRKMVQLMILRSQRPSEVKAFLVVVSLETYAKFVNSAMSFITFLKSFV